MRFSMNGNREVLSVLSSFYSVPTILGSCNLHLIGKSGDPNLRNSRREAHHLASQHPSAKPLQFDLGLTMGLDSSSLATIIVCRSFYVC